MNIYQTLKSLTQKKLRYTTGQMKNNQRKSKELYSENSIIGRKILKLKKKSQVAN